jgi:CRISPR-associated endonuclease/helicase Cas3/CRISPR-associated endonuclease Cas3-HD
MADAPISHPPDHDDGATELRIHLDAVACRTREVIPPGATTTGGDSLQEVATVVAKCHDVGKATTWFQAYVLGKLDSSKRTNHSLLGAYLGYYVLDRAGYDSEDCLAAFLAIAKHHGRLPNVEEYVDGVARFENESEANNRRQRVVMEQVRDIDDHRRSFAQSVVADATDDAGSWGEFVSQITDESLFGTVYEHFDQFSFGSDRSRPSEAFYQVLLQLWSGLILADKTTAAGIESGNLSASEPNRRVLSEYIDALAGGSDEGQSNALNRLREEARQKVLTTAETFRNSDDSIATLTLPTGMGKTLTGLSAALTIRGDGGRVIYALPFTSVIDQVADELTEVFDSDGRDDLLTIHHHLAETVTELDSGGDEATDEDAQLAEMVAESWRSGLTLTTFVQLFESLVGPGNSQSMKLPALYNSVIVLDEPQALPMKWWKLVRRLATILTEEYDATIVAMTATQPALFHDAVELVDNVDQYFLKFERVKYEIHESALAFDSPDATLDYASAGRTMLKQTGGASSALAVCNTIDSAVALTDTIEEQVPVVNVGQHLMKTLEAGPIGGFGIEDAGVENDVTAEIGVSVNRLVDRVADACDSGDRALVHLSTRLRPRDRLILIEATKRLSQRSVPLVAVSTQLIEAGVNISFDRVYRDIAPIDSIVQAAGRCNRSFERDCGTVTVWWLASPPSTTKTPSQAVYDSRGVSTISLTSKTLDAMDTNKGTLAERTMTREAVQHYFGLVSDRNPGDPKFVDWIKEAKAAELGNLSLIGKRDSVDVIVCRTDADRALVDAMRNALDRYDYEMFEEYRQRAKQITISLPIYSQDSAEAQTVADLNKIPDTELRILERSQSKTYFDMTTGLAVEGPSIEDRFL